MTKQEDKKSLVSFLSATKKQLLLNLDMINNILDTYRTNIHIVRYNLLENDKIPDNKLPKFDFAEAKKILTMFGNLLNGTIKNYHDIIEQQLQRPVLSDVNKEYLKKPDEKKGDKK